MAAGTYTRLVADAISSKTIDVAAVGEIAKKAVGQVDRAAEIIRRLRALVQLDRSNRAPWSLARIVSEAIEICRPDLDRANVTASFRLPGHLPPVMVDLLQIQQVLLNLLRNAVEAINGSSNAHGSIRIEAKKIKGELIELRVMDSGPGFSRERIEDAFLPLSSSKPEGLGIGLPLCRSIVEAHGGQLWVDPSSDGGCVRFTLPAATTS
jgi:two-component system, LuxR family, sensor kinase FixL